MESTDSSQAPSATPARAGPAAHAGGSDPPATMAQDGPSARAREHPEPPTRASTLRGIRSVAISTYLSRFAAIGSLLVLAHYLSPTDFGIAAVAGLIGGFLNNLSEFGLSASIISRGLEASRESLLRAARYRFLLGAAALAVLLLGSGAMAAVSGIADAGSAIFALGFVLPIVGSGFAPRTDMLCRREFGNVALADAMGGFVQAGATISLAVILHSYWAIVLGTLAGSAATTIVLWGRWHRGGPRGFLQLPGREILVLGGLVTASWLSSYAFFSLDRLAISTGLGPEQLGYYALAMQWATLGATSVGPLFGTVGLPTYAAIAKDTRRTQVAYKTTLSLISFLAVPLSVGLIIMGPELLILILGGGTSKWVASLGALQILAVLGLLRSLVEPGASIYLATGTFRKYWWLALIPIASFAITAALVPAATASIEGVAATMVIAYAANSVGVFWSLHRVMGAKGGSLLRPLMGPLLGGAAMGALVLPLRAQLAPSAFSLLLLPVVGGAIYFGALYVSGQWGAVREFFAFARGIMQRPRRAPLVAAPGGPGETR